MFTLPTCACGVLEVSERSRRGQRASVFVFIRSHEAAFEWTGSSTAGILAWFWGVFIVIFSTLLTECTLLFYFWEKSVSLSGVFLWMTSQFNWTVSMAAEACFDTDGMNESLIVRGSRNSHKRVAPNFTFAYLASADEVSNTSAANCFSIYLPQMVIERTQSWPLTMEERDI